MADKQQILARILDEVTVRLDLMKTNFPDNPKDLQIISRDYKQELNEELILVNRLDIPELFEDLKNELSFWTVIENLAYGSYQEKDLTKINQMRSLIIDSLTKSYNLLRN